jgi:hypothetical protein
MMVALNSLDEFAKKYFVSKHDKDEGASTDLALQIIDAISEPHFKLPLRSKGLVSNETTSFVYEDNMTYPNIFEFIAQLLHENIPISINDVKFGPGEIIVNSSDHDEAERKLQESMNLFREMVHTKRAEIVRT